jgi:UrcA family protein
MNTAIRRGATLVTGMFATALLHPAMAAAPSHMDETEPVQFTFQFSRAELATAQGTERLYQRLVRRADKACALPRTGSPGLRYKDRACIAELVEKMVRRIDAELLTRHWLHSTQGMPTRQQPVVLQIAPAPARPRR